ncbi:chemotaxis protein, partial [Brachyspira hampsonii]|nr:chemotaxis protein [Brachyspira hampsonii]
INLFDNVYWGIEVAVPSAMVLKNNNKMLIMIGIMISVMIILIIIIVPNIINRKVIPVINFVNNNKSKIKSYNIKSDDIVTDMNADNNNNTIEYLNNIIDVLKDKQYKISENSKSSVSNDDKSNNNYKFVNGISDNYKSITDESEELKNIIEYFKLIK